MRSALPREAPYEVVALGAGWLWVIWELMPHWATAEHYTYGWGMPVLCLYLWMRRWRCRPQAQPLTRVERAGWLAVAAALAVTWLPTRLLHEANPLWRPLALAWVGQMIGLTLALTALRGGTPWVRHFAFPAVFFALAVPWPSPVEHAVIQTLTSATTAATLALLHGFGIPALQQGNLIEVGVGIVGVTEACSGIRSLQTTLMLGLFLGELYRLKLGGRIGCLAAGAVLTCLGNICRTTTLTWLAASGNGRLERWHDALGMGVLMLTLTGTWVLASRLASNRTGAGDEITPLEPGTGAAPEPPQRMRAVAVGLISWFLVSEAAVHMWYLGRADRNPQFPDWSVERPHTEVAVREMGFPEAMHRLLRFDGGMNFTWRAADGVRWQMIYLRWLPGGAAVSAASLHSPEVCLPALGMELQRLPDHAHVVPGSGVELPFQVFRFEHGIESGFVFFCRVGDRSDGRPAQSGESVWRQRLRWAWEGRAKEGMRLLEVAVWGLQDEAEAKWELGNVLQCVRVEGIQKAE